MLACTEDLLHKWLSTIEAHYHSGNTYHNATHAADVLQVLPSFYTYLPHLMNMKCQTLDLILILSGDFIFPGFSFSRSPCHREPCCCSPDCCRSARSRSPWSVNPSHFRMFIFLTSGRGNAFLINTRQSLAVLYNDHSVLENHHVALAFQLTLQQNSNVSITFSHFRFSSKF